MVSPPVPTETSDFQWDGPSVLKSLIFAAITISTIGGNGMVLLAMIFKRKNLKSSTHYLIASLSLADFLVGVLVMPLLAIFTVTGKWYLGRWNCIAFRCVHNWLCAASILSVTAICVERYIGVRYPLKHFKFMNGRRVMQGCGIVWAMAGIFGIGPLIITPEPFPDDDPYTCPVNFQVFHVAMVMIFVFYKMCALMIGLYLRIYCIARAHLEGIAERWIETHGMSSDSSILAKEKSTESTNITNNSNSDSCEVEDGRKMKMAKDVEAFLSNRKKQTVLAKKLFLVIGAFFICYLPFFTTFMLKAIDPNIVSDQVFTALEWIRYFNSCLNPMIYAAMLKPFRNAFKEFLHLVPRKSK